MSSTSSRRLEHVSIVFRHGARGPTEYSQTALRRAFGEHAGVDGLFPPPHEFEELTETGEQQLRHLGEWFAAYLKNKHALAGAGAAVKYRASVVERVRQSARSFIAGLREAAASPLAIPDAPTEYESLDAADVVLRGWRLSQPFKDRVFDLLHEPSFVARAEAEGARLQALYEGLGIQLRGTDGSDVSPRRASLPQMLWHVATLFDLLSVEAHWPTTPALLKASAASPRRGPHCRGDCFSDEAAETTVGAGGSSVTLAAAVGAETSASARAAPGLADACSCHDGTLPFSAHPDWPAYVRSVGSPRASPGSPRPAVDALPVPPADRRTALMSRLTPSEAAFIYGAAKWVMEVKLMHGRGIAAIAKSIGAPLFLELLGDAAAAAASSDAPPVSLYAAHDYTILFLLAAMRAPHPVNALGYGSFVLVESWREVDEDGRVTGAPLITAKVCSHPFPHGWAGEPTRIDPQASLETLFEDVPLESAFFSARASAGSGAATTAEA